VLALPAMRENFLVSQKKVRTDSVYNVKRQRGRSRGGGQGFSSVILRSGGKKGEDRLEDLSIKGGGVEIALFFASKELEHKKRRRRYIDSIRKGMEKRKDPPRRRKGSPNRYVRKEKQFTNGSPGGE